MTRSRALLAGTVAIAGGLLLLTIAFRPSDAPSVTPIALPSPSAVVQLPPAYVQAVMDSIAPPYGGVIRVDRKVAVQLRGVDRRNDVGIWGATDGTWAVAAVGEFRQTRGLLPAPNHQCHIWYVNAAGFAFASRGGDLGTCDAYMSAQ